MVSAALRVTKTGEESGTIRRDEYDVDDDGSEKDDRE